MYRSYYSGLGGEELDCADRLRKRDADDRSGAAFRGLCHRLL